MRCCIITACDARYAPIADITLPIMYSYAKRHGYAIEVGKYREDPTLLDHWGDRGKWGLYVSWWQKYDAIMWLDADVVITNRDVTIEERLGDRPFIWSYDNSGPCSGWWIARCIPEVFMTVNKIRDEGRIGRACVVSAAEHPARTIVSFEPYGRSDQDVMRSLMAMPPHDKIIGSQNCVSLKEAGHCFDFRALNMPTQYDYIGNWEPGDWLYTVPSLELGRRQELLAHKAQEVWHDFSGAACNGNCIHPGSEAYARARELAYPKP